MEASEQELIRDAVAGDEAAFHGLVDRHAPSLFRSALALSRNRADAEDLLQETFVAAFRGIKNFGGRSSIRTWLMRILTRKAFKVLNRAKRRQMLPLESVDVPQPDPNQGTDRRLDVMQVLQCCSEPHRQILTLREIEGLSYDEIATILELPRGTVESRLFRARLEFKQKFMSR